MQGWAATTRRGVTKKEAQKRLQDTEKVKEEGNSKKSYFFPKIVFIVSLYS